MSLCFISHISSAIHTANRCNNAVEQYIFEEVGSTVPSSLNAFWWNACHPVHNFAIKRSRTWKGCRIFYHLAKNEIGNYRVLLWFANWKEAQSSWEDEGCGQLIARLTLYCSKAIIACHETIKDFHTENHAKTLEFLQSTTEIEI